MRTSIRIISPVVLVLAVAWLAGAEVGTSAQGNVTEVTSMFLVGSALIGLGVAVRKAV